MAEEPCPDAGDICDADCWMRGRCEVAAECRRKRGENPETENDE